MPSEITNKDKEPCSLSVKDEKTINMDLLMLGLKISEGDLVVIDQTILYCNNKSDLVSYPSLKYSSSVPNLILGMISGKYKYKVIKISEIKSILDGLINSGKLTEHYEKFPETPEGFENWVNEAENLWKKAGKLSDWKPEL